jgi:hypothetical protein
MDIDDLTIVEAASGALVERLRVENAILKEQLGACQLEIQRLRAQRDSRAV